jgi:hypothetical protein
VKVGEAVIESNEGEEPGAKLGDAAGSGPGGPSAASGTPMNIEDVNAPGAQDPRLYAAAGTAYTDFEARPVVNQMANTHHGNYATAAQ